jgi:hypothetical protein
LPPLAGHIVQLFFLCAQSLPRFIGLLPALLFALGVVQAPTLSVMLDVDLASRAQGASLYNVRPLLSTHR